MSITRRIRNIRPTRRQIAVHSIGLTMLAFALIGGAYLGSSVNRAPAKADTTPPPAVGLTIGTSGVTAGSGSLGSVTGAVQVGGGTGGSGVVGAVAP